MQPAGGHVGVAFACVIGAGLCTTLGACAAFSAKLASPKSLAVGLGLSAGVMLYDPRFRHRQHSVACFVRCVCVYVLLRAAAFRSLNLLVQVRLLRGDIHAERCYGAD